SQELVDVICGAPERIEYVRAVAYQGTGAPELAELRSQRDAVAQRQFDDPFAMGDLDAILCRHDGLGAEFRRSLEPGVDISWAAQFERSQLHAEQRRSELDLFEFLDRADVVRSPEHRHAGQGRQSFLEQLEPLGA